MVQGLCQPESGEIHSHNGVVRAIADLPDDAIITEDGLARLLGKCRVSIKRAVRRHELPEPVGWFGQRAWTAKAIRDHLDGRLSAAQHNIQKAGRRIAALDA